MAYRRTSLRSFALANPAYANAVVSVFTADPATGTNLEVLATLYEGVSGTSQLPNPITLDAAGKFPSPVYVDQPVVAVVVGAAVGDHTTGVFVPASGRYQGDWAPITLYYPDDQVKVVGGAFDGKLYVCTVQHTSSAVQFSDDLGQNRWELVYDLSVAVTAEATVQALVDQADADAAAAAASATLAQAWATQTPGAVSGGEFSAKKHAQDAAASAVAADASADAAAISVTNASGYAATALSASADAQAWATQTPGAVSGGEFSAKKHAQDAAASAASAATAATGAVKVTDSDTAASSLSAAVTADQSVAATVLNPGGNETLAVRLVNDSAAPGANRVYGTDGSGVKGWVVSAAVTGSAVDAAVSTGTRNVTVGSRLLSLTFGLDNTGFGHRALNSLDEANYSTAVGSEALQALTVGSVNTAVGHKAGYLTNSGSANTYIGAFAGHSGTGAADNTIVGYNSAYSMTSGSRNSALGRNALQNISGNSDCVAVGHNALVSPGSANGIVAIGASAAPNGQAANLIAIGYEAMGSVSNKTGARNIAVGYRALHALTTGADNVAVGDSAMLVATIGATSVAIGTNALTAMTTGTNNTAIGHGAGSSITTGSNNVCIGNNAQPTNATINNTITLGNASIAFLRCQATTITSLSDARDKKNVTDLDAGLGFIERVRPVRFQFDKRDWYEDRNPNGSKLVPTWRMGFIAQEYRDAILAEGVDWMRATSLLEENPDQIELAALDVVFPLVAAVKELAARVQALEGAS